MKIRKRVISALLAAVMTVSLAGTASLSAQASESTSDDTDVIVDTEEVESSDQETTLTGDVYEIGGDDAQETADEASSDAESSSEEGSSDTGEEAGEDVSGENTAEDASSSSSSADEEAAKETGDADADSEDASGSVSLSLMDVDFSSATLLLNDSCYYDENDDLCFSYGESGTFGLDLSSDYYSCYEDIEYVEYESGDTSVLTVDSDGNYQAVGCGYAALYVTVVYMEEDTDWWYEDGEIVEETYEYEDSDRFFYYIKVNPDMSGVTLSKSSFTVYWSEDCYMDTTVTVKINSDYNFTAGDEFTDFSIDSSSSKVYGYYTLEDNVITFDLYGTGKSTITVTLNEKTYKIKVTMRKVYCSTDSVLLSPGKTKTVSVKGITSSTTVKWSSSNKKVATVNSKGKITAKKAGNAVITAKVNGKIKVGCVVSVTSAKKVKVVKKAIKIASTSTYSQAKRMQSGYYDCSSLVWKAYSAYGVYFGSKNYAPTAANLAKYLNKKGKLKGSYSYKKTQKMVMRAGDVVFKTGSNNGRYKGIYHVELFAGYALSYYDSSGTAVVTTTWAARGDGYADSGNLYGRP